jgi:hypothetical protein
MIIISLKKKQDVLQGISKLDILLKVSMFQVYKDIEQQRHKLSFINTTTTQSLRYSFFISQDLNQVFKADFISSVFISS